MGKTQHIWKKCTAHTSKTHRTYK